MAIAKIEVTDTFGGEANYSWVKRYEIKLNEKYSDYKIVREAKKLAGWTGLKCQREEFSDTIRLKPSKVCQVMFITFEVDGWNHASVKDVTKKG
jgi:hypothetical protein